MLCGKKVGFVADTKHQTLLTDAGITSLDPNQVKETAASEMEAEDRKAEIVDKMSKAKELEREKKQKSLDTTKGIFQNAHCRNNTFNFQNPRLELLRS